MPFLSFWLMPFAMLRLIISLIADTPPPFADYFSFSFHFIMPALSCLCCCYACRYALAFALFAIHAMLPAAAWCYAFWCLYLLFDYAIILRWCHFFDYFFAYFSIFSAAFAAAIFAYFFFRRHYAATLLISFASFWLIYFITPFSDAAISFDAMLMLCHDFHFWHFFHFDAFAYFRLSLITISLPFIDTPPLFIISIVWLMLYAMLSLSPLSILMLFGAAIIDAAYAIASDYALPPCWWLRQILPLFDAWYFDMPSPLRCLADISPLMLHAPLTTLISYYYWLFDISLRRLYFITPFRLSLFAADADHFRHTLRFSPFSPERRRYAFTPTPCRHFATLTARRRRRLHACRCWYYRWFHLMPLADWFTLLISFSSLMPFVDLMPLSPFCRMLRFRFLPMPLFFAAYYFDSCRFRHYMLTH